MINVVLFAVLGRRRCPGKYTRGGGLQATKELASDGHCLSPASGPALGRTEVIEVVGTVSVTDAMTSARLEQGYGPSPVPLSVRLISVVGELPAVLAWVDTLNVPEDDDAVKLGGETSQEL